MKKYIGVLVLIIGVLPGISFADIVISDANNISIEATDENGAAVTYAPTAIDGETALAVSCDPVSGSTFPIGVTTVTCSADSGETSVEAQFTVTVTAEPAPTPAPESVLTVTAEIDLPNGCDVTDSSATLHVFPEVDSTSEYLAICALQVALENNVLEDITFNDFGFGLFVDNFNGFEKPENTYWQFQVNGESSNVGAAEAAIAAGDTISFVLTAFDPVTFAETPLSSSVTLYVNTLTETYHNIVLTDECSVPVGSEMREFPQEDSPSAYLGICALAQAKEAGIITDYTLIEFPGFGLFADSVNGVQNPDTSFWALYYNGVFEETRGLIVLPLAAGDTLSLVFTNFITNETSDRIDVRIIGLAETLEETPSTGGSTGSSGNPSPQTFDVPKALAFLAAQQNTDGSFANILVSDWTALAFAAQDPGQAKNKLRTYLLSNPAAGSDITDYERRAMALLALGINPYTGTGVDYITPIVNSFDGTQIGAVITHDDIFAIFPLLHAGYSTGDTIIQKSVAYIITKQSANGSWGDPDTTAAAVQALSLVQSQPGVADALARAKTYLHALQQNQNTGGFGNSFSTAWTLLAVAAFGESPAQWTVNAKTPVDHLVSLQQSDGGVDATSVSADSRTWATAFAVPGALGKTWDSLLSSVAKPATGAQTIPILVATSTAATSTPVIPLATSTLPIETTPNVATSTIALATAENTVQPVTLVPKTIAKKVVTKKVPPAATTTPPVANNTTQTASAASGAGGSVLGKIWGSVVSFFKKIF